MLLDEDRLRWIERAGLTTGRDRGPFDRVTRLVQQLLHVPISLVSTVTDQVQVFTGAAGMGDLPETPLSHSLCRFVVDREAPLVLPDTHADTFVCNHPAVRDLRVRAYLGVPFAAPSGQILGSVSAVDTQPHAWTDADVRTLEDLARLVETEIALRLELAVRAETEARLRHDNDALGLSILENEAALGASDQALRAANERLARQNIELIRRQEELRAFTAVLSHDLQEPVRKIRTFASLLAPALPDPEDHLHLERIEQTAEQMHARLRALVSYAEVSLTNGQSSPIDVDLTLLVTARANAFAQGDVSITCDELPTVRGHFDLLGRLFGELFDNAVRFRRQGLPLRVHVSSERFDLPGGEEVELRVEDSGMGFEPRHAQRIFEPFERLLPLAEHAGTGLGLTLCRRIAERHGGTLRAESTPGAGSTFVLRLPVGGPVAA